MIITHGGDIASFKSIFDGPLLDFSVNLNPLGIPKPVYDAIANSASSANLYPDPLCRELSCAIASSLNVPPDYVLCGNGAADIIFRILFALKPSRVLLTAPTFAEYELAANAVDANVCLHFLSPDLDFVLSDDFLDQLSPDIDLLFLCNPNNPTGQLIPQHLLIRIVNACRDFNIRLVVDECFLEMTDDYANATLIPLLPLNPHLIILRAFTKTYAIPGVRLGFCLSSDSDFLNSLSLCAQPWSVSSTAIAAGLACLSIPDYPSLARDFLRVERPLLSDLLSNAGLSVFPASANYILFRAPFISDLKHRLIPHGILIRSCANYHGLLPDFYRVAVRSHSDNSVLINSLKVVL